jgi:hypothetical protein
MKKFKTVKAWAVLGNDNSLIDQIYYYKEHAIEKWGGSGGGVRILSVEIRIPLKTRKP